MKLQYLGTGGGGGIPEMFCTCRVCQNARVRGGRELRSRPLAILDGELCIDLPCDARSSFLAWNVDAQKIRYLSVTHNHYDHFLADNLISRPAGARPIQVYISHGSGQEIARKSEKFKNAPIRADVRPVCAPEVHFVEPFVPFTCGRFRVTPLPARHDETVEALNFLIETEKKAVLWLHDTGLLLEETVEYLGKIKPRLDLVSMDCALPRGRYISDDHMDILRCNETAKLLRELGCADDHTAIYLSHISHLVECTYEELSAQAEEHGFQVAYDGAVIEV